MSLTVVSTPIGNFEDITIRAKKVLENADLIICEERRPASTLLKKLGINGKELRELNEHSQPQDVRDLLSLCRKSAVALISDCGTPGFSDPGAILVQACYGENIDVHVCPGPSSLMALVAVCGVDLKEFHFAGFLSAESEKRKKQIVALAKTKTPVFLMDTPYRINTVLVDLAKEMPDRTAVLGLDLTGANHQVVRKKLRELGKTEWEKLPFVLLLI
ncbi:MAG: methyltransferase [Oligoflexia bacterium]|nr:methyltransferase [Oligoflexia bacterium]